MTQTIVNFGNKIVSQASAVAPVVCQSKSSAPLVTIADVLRHLEHKMLRTVVAYIALCQKLPAEKIRIDALIDFRRPFAQFLEHQENPKLSPDTIETYCDLA